MEGKQTKNHSCNQSRNWRVCFPSNPSLSNINFCPISSPALTKYKHMKNYLKSQRWVGRKKVKLLPLVRNIVFQKDCLFPKIPPYKDNSVQWGGTELRELLDLATGIQGTLFFKTFFLFFFFKEKKLNNNFKRFEHLHSVHSYLTSTSRFWGEINLY